ncbi:hypothetical protein EAF00_008743 [Botryotinia globosa]|nr:hypothetical protein EAF00_008743 [Botryotinia globosa]
MFNNQKPNEILLEKPPRSESPSLNCHFLQHQQSPEPQPTPNRPHTYSRAAHMTHAESFSPHLTPHSILPSIFSRAPASPHPLHVDVKAVKAVKGRTKMRLRWSYKLPVTNCAFKVCEWSACGIPVLISPRRFTEFVKLTLSHFTLFACI